MTERSDPEGLRVSVAVGGFRRAKRGFRSGALGVSSWWLGVGDGVVLVVDGVVPAFAVPSAFDECLLGEREIWEWLVFSECALSVGSERGRGRGERFPLLAA